MRQPIGLGTLDAPTTRDVPRAGFLLRGWALDPSGASAIRISTGTHAAKVGREAWTASPELASIYGGYPGAGRANLEFNVPAAWLEAPEVRLKVEVENQLGVVTEIDRRLLRPRISATAH